MLVMQADRLEEMPLLADLPRRVSLQRRRRSLSPSKVSLRCWESNAAEWS